tara:strand:+ start:259 stop:432 length:174 start_codon:yes stop_codon:yes gene_type:complete
MNKEQKQIIKNWRHKQNQLMAKKILNEKTITINMYNNVIDHIDGLPAGWKYEIVQHK